MNKLLTMYLMGDVVCRTLYSELFGKVVKRLEKLILQSSFILSWLINIMNYLWTINVFNRMLFSGHFTQVVWKDSKEFGIGKAITRDGKVIIVGQYKPAGNLMGAFQENVFPPGTQPQQHKPSQPAEEGDRRRGHFSNTSSDDDRRGKVSILEYTSKIILLESCHYYPFDANGNILLDNIKTPTPSRLYLRNLSIIMSTPLCRHETYIQKNIWNECDCSRLLSLLFNFVTFFIQRELPTLLLLIWTIQDPI